MLVEEFVASIGIATKPTPSTAIAKDAAVFIHEFQPLVAQRGVFKKSVTLSQCLALSRSHVFAAQADKAVVHVYNRGKGNQEAIVPFQERISSIALACNDAVLILGTVEGRIILWETYSGRQITTANSHLQPITSIAVDHDSNHVLSASADSTVHVWSLSALLSFSSTSVATTALLRTFTGHRAEIVALSVGHSSSFCNIAISTAKDKTCLVWDIHTATLLRTFLLPAIPTCMTIDPADRAIYVGYEDGSLQQLDIFSTSKDFTTSNLDAVQNGSNSARPIQPSNTSRWVSPDSSNGVIASICLSYDGSIVLTGHNSGHILSWEVGRGSFRSVLTQQPLPGPITNLHFLPIRNSAQLEPIPGLTVPEVVKPKFGAFDVSDDAIPGNYIINAQIHPIHNATKVSSREAFLTSLNLPSFTDDVLDRGLDELRGWRQGVNNQSNGLSIDVANDGDRMSLDDPLSEANRADVAEQENKKLKQQLEALRNLQVISFTKIEKLSAERKALLQREQRRLNNSNKMGSDIESE